MKVIRFLDEENNKFYDIESIKNILGVSKSKVQREIKRNNFSNDLLYKNQFLYSENTLLGLMEKIYREKFEKLND